MREFDLLSPGKTIAFIKDSMSGFFVQEIRANQGQQQHKDHNEFHDIHPPSLKILGQPISSH